MTPVAPPTPADVEIGPTGPDWAVLLERELVAQRELCDALEALVALQPALVGEGDPDALAEHMLRRQAVVDRLAETGARIAPLRRRWETAASSIPAATRDRLRTLADAIGAALGRINERDESDRAALEARRDRVRRELAGFDAARGAVAAYAPARDDGARFQDRKG